jgi:membrane protein implicated in regulation of membrane protease activity
MLPNIFSRPEIFWFLLGLVLFLAELFMPGFIIFFFGVGAWATAVLCLVADPGINLQIIVFAITSVIALLIFRRLLRRKFFHREHVIDVDDEFTGKEAIAKNDFSHDRNGKVEFKGTIWNAESDSEIKDGQRVIILQKDNFKLIVEPKKQ